MDIKMSIYDGIYGTQIIHQNFPETKVLILTTFPNSEYLTQCLRFGALGYLLKDTPFEELTQAIRMVAKGYIQISPGLTDVIFHQFFSPKLNYYQVDWNQLTTREKDIVNMIKQGASNREISQVLFISEKTVKNNITNILSRLNLRDRTQLAIAALQLENY